MVYNIEITDRAEKQIENAIQYLAVNIKSMQAANNLMEDINQAFALLEAFEASFSFCEDSYLASKGYRKFALKKHDYLIIYRVEENTVYLVGFFPVLENYREKL